MIKNNQQLSVVIPCFNDHEYIEQAIDSVVAERNEKIEIIVVDDGSDAKTKKVLNFLRPKISKLITQENKGVSAARNIGIKNSSGSIIVVLDSDDYFEKSFFEKGCKILNGKPDVKLVTCYARRFDENGTIDIHKPQNSYLIDFLKYNSAMGSVMFRKSDWKKCGGYDENLLKGFEDWEFYINLLKKGGISYSIPEVMFHYRLRENSRTKSANKKRAELLMYIYKKHKNLYLQHFEAIMIYYTKRVEVLERSELRIKQKFDYKIGRIILTPYRKLKALLLSQ